MSHRLRHFICPLATIGLACLLPRTSGLGAAELPDYADDDQPTLRDIIHPRYWRVEAEDQGKDWIRLVSHEWLRGEIKSLRNDVLIFDSDKLKERSFKLKDVAEIIPGRPVGIYLEDKSRFMGSARLDETHIILGSSDQRRIPRTALVTMVRQQPRERDRWSGNLSLGAALTAGNSERRDLTWSASAIRRTLQTRMEFNWSGQYGESNGLRDVQRQQADARFDYYLGRFFYLTIPKLELLHDYFQNIDRRSTPSVSLGYALAKQGDDEWLVDLGIGYRRTDYVSVTAGSDDVVTDVVLLASTTLNWELTDQLDIKANHQLQQIIDGGSALDQSFSASVIVEVIDDFKVDVTFRWDHLDEPQTDADGNTPKQDDYTLSTGVGWKF